MPKKPVFCQFPFHNVMMKNIPTEALRSFVTIAELGSFTQAGDKLARSQSAISLQIKKLEALIGQQLFKRRGHHFELTTAGETLIKYAHQILQLNDRALGALNQQAIEGKVKLGIPSEFAIALLPKIVGSFARKNPQITLEVVCDLSRNLNADLKQQKYDLILSIVDNPNDTTGHFIKKDRLVWIAATEHYEYDRLPLPLIVAPEGCIYRNRAIQQLNQTHIPWRIIYTIMDLSGIQSAIEEGLGITVLAESALPNTLKITPPPRHTEPLGDIDLTLLTADTNPSDVTLVLADYIKQHLK